MNKLKPCPFCGSEASIKTDELKNVPDDDAFYSYVICEKCGSTGQIIVSINEYGKHIGIEKTTAQAIEAWNRRVE